MKIDAFMMTALENFAAINSAAWLDAGNVIGTVSPTKALVARVEVDTEFPRSFGLYKLGCFINVLGMYKEPEITFEDTHLLVSDSSQRSTKITYGDPTLFDDFQKAWGLEFPSSDIKTSFSAELLRDMDKAIRVLGVSDLIIEGDGKVLTITATNFREPGCNYHSVQLGETDSTFKAVIKHANMTLLPANYEVEIIPNKRTPSIKLTAPRIKYLVALDKDSKF
jgi:hypothetical protein